MRKAQVQPMSRGDVSFTFLDRVTEVEQNILDQRWQSALALALTLPDICGGIAFPEIVKKYRDGRAMRDRNGKASRDIGKQYIKWVDTFASPYLKKDPTDAEPYISGERCWQLRCEYLHQNTLSQKEEELRSMEQQKSELDQQTESLMEIMKQKAATIYLYGQLMEEAAQSARMKEYSRTIVRESESMISQISGFHSNDM